MNLDVLGTIRLLHRVLGFLAGQSTADLTAIADGRRSLTLDAAPGSTATRSAGPALGPSPGEISGSRPGGFSGSALGSGSGENPGPRTGLASCPDSASGPASDLGPGTAAKPDPPSRPSPTRNQTPADVDYGQIAARLRGSETTTEAAVFLSQWLIDGKKPKKVDLVRLGAEMNLTLSPGKTVGEMHTRLVNHAIGARKKFAGLSKW